MSDKTTKIELVGAKELEELFKAFGPRVAKRSSDRGIRKALVYLRREFRAAAPKQDGDLRRAIKYRYSPRSGRGWVGLRERFYYKTLEFTSERGAPLHPFFERAWLRAREKAAQMIVDQAKIALSEEAGKALARSKRVR